ncbi:50S ribosomal protein L10 [Candidatus Woesearchaeota archaeon]|nr:50S ribosomal protein L10 [Candidatus Woesearchaeota archaeon]
MAEVSEYKKKIVEEMSKLVRQYPVVGLVNLDNLPAPQLQSMRTELRGKISMFITKKRLMKIAFEKTKSEKKNIEEICKYFEGMPALIFTNENPFRLSKLLQKSKTSAPAKAGQIAPKDIIVRKGPTPFAPGPVISELSSVGIKVGVESGKVAVKEDAIVAKKGEKIKPKAAEILTRLDIKPMQVGLGLVAAYEDGIIYQRDTLEIDEKEFNDKVSLAAVQAFNLAFDIAYPTKDNVSLLIAKAFSDAKALGISQKILDRGIVEDLISMAEMEMLSLKSTANIESKEEKVLEKEKTEEKLPAEEKKAEKEALQEAKKEEVKPKPPKEEPKADKTEEPKADKIEKTAKPDEQKSSEQTPAEQETPEDEVDKKVRKMVEKTKKFAEGKEETAADILEDVKKEESESKKPEEKKEGNKKLPTAHDLKKNKEEKENKKDTDAKKVEELAKELLKKGTLRKK